MGFMRTYWSQLILWLWNLLPCIHEFKKKYPDGQPHVKRCLHCGYRIYCEGYIPE